MTSVGQYILCVVCTVILCGVVRMLLPGNENSIMKLVTGLVTMVVVLSPLLGRGHVSFRTHFGEILEDSETAAHSGVLAARDASIEFIKEKSEAYVLNKASELGANVSVSVALSEEEFPVPAHITVCGALSPYIKMKLSECIREELGIVEDEQVWTS